MRVFPNLFGAVDPQNRDDLRTILVVALITRIVGAFISQHYLPVVADDTVALYLPVARSIAEGTGFSVRGSYVEAARVPPLYSIWLSGWMLFTGPTIPLWIIALGNAFLRAVACVLLFELARRSFGRSVGMAAAVLYIIDPWETFWAGFVLKESLAVPLFLLAVLALAAAAERADSRTTFLAGVAAGFAALSRFPDGGIWLVAVLTLGAAARRAGARWRSRFAASLAVYSAAMLLTLSPWLVRNWRVVGEPVLTTRFVGRKLYTSNGPGISSVTDGYYSPSGISPAVVSGLRDDRDVTGAEAGLAGMTLKYMATHPAEVLRRLPDKVVNMWQPTFAEHSRRNSAFLGSPYVALMLLSLAGIVIALRLRLGGNVIGLTLIVFIGIHLLFRGEIRNRQYLTPLFYAFGGVTVVALTRRFRVVSRVPSV